VGDRVHDLLTVVLSAQNTVAVAPDAGSLFLQQPRDLEHLLGISPPVADEDLRLVANLGSLTNHGADSDRSVKP